MAGSVRATFTKDGVHGTTGETISITLEDADDYLVAVWLLDFNDTYTSLVFDPGGANEVNFTQEVANTAGDGGVAVYSLQGADLPGAGTYDVQVNWSDNNVCKFWVMACQGFAQQGAEATNDHANQNAGSASTSEIGLTTLTDGALVFDCHEDPTGDSTAATADSGQTVIADNTSQSFFIGVVGYEEIASAGSVTQGWSNLQAGDGDYSAAIAAFAPASTGTTASITATMAGASTDSGGVTSTDSLTSSLTGTSADSGGISSSAALSATMPGVSTDSVGTVILNIAATTTMAGTSSDSGSITSTDSISSTMAGTSTDSGTISLLGVLQIAATLAGTSSDSGAITSTSDLGGTLPGTSSDSGGISSTAALLSTMAGISTDSGSVVSTVSLASTLAGTSADSGTIQSHAAILATMAGTSTDSGSLTEVGVFLGLNIAVSVDQPLDLDADVDQPLDMDVDVEPKE